MTAPAPRPGPDVAGRLAETARDFLSDCEEWPTGLELAAALLPTVDAIAAEWAADELEAVAHRLDDGGDEAVEVALGGAPYVHRVLCDRAAALRGER